MGMFRMLAVATIGVVAWRAWQRRQAGAAATRAVIAPRDTTPPHGDPLRTRILDDEDDIPSSPGAQFSRGFGGT